jgi:hypothetical protein
MSFPAYPAEQFVQHIGKSGNGLSPRLWADYFQTTSSPSGEGESFGFLEDFLLDPITSGWTIVGDHTTTVSVIAGAGGIAELTSDATDNDEGYMSTGESFVISDTAGADKKLAFECRFRLPQITNTYNAFIGLGPIAAANMLQDDGALAAAEPFLGFYVAEADGNALTFTYQAISQTPNTLIADTQVLVADTFYKVGFLYDPAAVASKRIRIFVDNVEQTTYVTATQIAAATFPDAEAMAAALFVKNAEAVDKEIEIDWIACAQQR